MPDGDRLLLIEKIDSAPIGPGCYLYMDKYGNIIYVGKAKNLRSRVKSYFTCVAEKDERLEELLPRIVDVEYRPTASELDALILEYRLIKKHKPWFNSQMKADKVRPFLRLAKEGRYATLNVATIRANDSATYYDFFTDEDDVRAAIDLFGDIWMTARCGKSRFDKKTSPCIYHSMGRCMAPCAHIADADAYEEAFEDIKALLQGKMVPLLARMHSEMEACAQKLQFEQAENIRRKQEGLLRLLAKSTRMYNYPESAAVLVLIRPFNEASFSAFFVRYGAVLYRYDFVSMPGKNEVDAMLSEWRGKAMPGPEDGFIARCLTEISADKVFIRLPERVTCRVVMKEINKFLSKR